MEVERGVEQSEQEKENEKEKEPLWDNFVEKDVVTGEEMDKMGS